MKHLIEFNTNLQYPIFVDSEMLSSRAEYCEFLLRKGYAYDDSVVKVEPPKTDEVKVDIEPKRTRKSK